MAKQVKVYFLCDGSAECLRAGRFDLTVEKSSFAMLNHGATYSLKSNFVDWCGRDPPICWDNPVLFDDYGFHIHGTQLN